jgi:hypothetical protein
MVYARPATETRKSLFRMVSGIAYGTPALGRPAYLRLEGGVGGRGPLWARLNPLPIRRRGAERKHLCGWHLFFALIFRVRRLSARKPGPASSVEACHPHCTHIIQQLAFECQVRTRIFRENPYRRLGKLRPIFRSIPYCAPAVRLLLCLKFIELHFYTCGESLEPVKTLSAQWMGAQKSVCNSS